MIRYILNLLLVILVISCGKNERYKRINREFLPYVMRYEKLSKELGLNITVDNIEMVFVDYDEVIQSNDSYVGLCETGIVESDGFLGFSWRSKPPKIKIVREFWYSTGYPNIYDTTTNTWCHSNRDTCLKSYRESTIFHELNHCVRGIKDHDNEFFENTTTYHSIMAFNFMENDKYIANYDHYIRDLFGLSDSYRSDINLIFDISRYND